MTARVLRPRIVQLGIDAPDGVAGVDIVIIDVTLAPLISHSRMYETANLTAAVVTLRDELVGLLECHPGRKAEDVGLLDLCQRRRLQELRLDRDQGGDSNDDQAGDNNGNLHQPLTRNIRPYNSRRAPPGLQKRKPRLGEAGLSDGGEAWGLQRVRRASGEWFKANAAHAATSFAGQAGTPAEAMLVFWASMGSKPRDFMTSGVNQASHCVVSRVLSKALLARTKGIQTWRR